MPPPPPVPVAARVNVLPGAVLAVPGLTMPVSTIVTAVFFATAIGELKVTLVAERLVKLMLPLVAPLVTVPPVAALASVPPGNVTVIAVDAVKLQPLVFGVLVVSV